ncbi:MAG: hypothetical protein RL742_1781, partial [Bacteroidota bacterium]
GNGASSHVNGYAAWSGQGPFVLPIGNGTRQMPVELEGDCSTLFQAAYFSGDPGSATLPADAPFSTTSKPAGVTVSQKEYWDINGAAATPITLFFDADSDLDLIAADLSELVILGWDGTAWVSLGQSASLGTLDGDGFISSDPVIPDNYSVYTIGALAAITCPADTTLNTGDEMDYNCSVSLLLNHPDLDDNAPVTLSIAFAAGMPTPVGSLPVGGTVTENGSASYDFGVGATTVTYTAEDQNNNTSECSFTVTVNDNEKPSITCPADQTVSADATCGGTIGDRTGDATASDNCAATVTVTQSPASTTALNGHNDAETVTLTADDGNGNTETCTFTVTLKDDTKPTITCPADQTVSADATCGGTVGAHSAVSTADNCTASPTVTQSPASTTALNGHNDAETVTLTADDGNGNTETCTFTVTLKDVTKPTITCPADQTVSTDANCAGTVGDRTGDATASDNCAATVTVTQSPASTTALNGHNDAETVTLTADDGNGNTETCTFTVTLKDVTAPTITGALTTTPAEGCTLADAPDAATTVAELEALPGGAVVSDVCAADNALTVSHSDSNTGTCPIVLTRTYTVTDPAGNAATVTQTIQIDDTTPPAVAGDLDPTNLTMCNVADTTAPVTTVAALEALDADNDLNISDACTADGSLSVGCTSTVTGSKPTFTLTRTYSITDICGNTTFLTHSIQITVTCFTISGKLLHAKSLPAQVGVEAATMRLTGSSPTGTFATTANGEYSFNINTAGFNPHTTIIRPHKTNNKINGVSVADATRVQQHIVGNDPLTNVYDLIAADVNRSKSVSSADAVLISQALRGSPSALAQFDSSWRFVSSSYVFPDPPYYPTPPVASPFWSFPLHRGYTNLDRDTSGQDFVGVKLGDVVTPFSNPNRPDSENTLTLVANDRVLRAGEEVTVAFRAVRFQDLAALQFALRFDPNLVDYRGFSAPSASPFQEANFGFYSIDAGEIRAVWSVSEGVDLPDGELVFNLRFVALADAVRLSQVLQLADEVLPREAYHTDLSPLDVELQFLQRARPTGISQRDADESDADGPTVLLLQNQPNPFQGQTTIGFVLGEPMHARLRVFDITGRLLFERAAQYPAGYQAVEFRLDERTVPGMLMVELTTKHGTQTRKMNGY